MKRVVQKWSEEEDRILLNQIKANATNLAKAFRKTSDILKNRSVSACAQRWYATLSKNPNTGVCLVTIGHKTVNKNRKNISSVSGITETKTDSWWKKFLKMIGM